MHTPGPWIILGNGDIVHPTGKYLIPEAEWNDTIAYVWDRRDGHAEHDRKLIAAAPELLAALETAMELGAYRRDRMPIKAVKPIFDAMKAAIAKAKGETL